MTQLKHKKISMLLVCLLVLLFSVAPTFADTDDNTFIVGDTFTKNIMIHSEEFLYYNLNFEAKGTYRITISSSVQLYTIFCNPLDYTKSQTVEFAPNAPGLFDITVDENMADGKLLDYPMTFFCFEESDDLFDYTITIEKIN